MKPIYLFLGGAAVGAIAALLFAPETGEETRARLKAFLKSRGLLPVVDNNIESDGEVDEFDALMQQISAEIKEDETVS